MQLYYRIHGKGPAIVLLHGLFGSHDNWARVTRALSAHFTVIVPDQRNHGASGHSPEMDYPAMAEDVRELLEVELFSECHLVGHSMGGKAAMEFALRYPERTSSLVVEDIAPRSYPVYHREIIQAMLSVPLSSLQSLTEVEHYLTPAMPDPIVRRFMLKNVRRDASGRFYWRLGLRELLQNVELISAGLQPGRQYSGPALFIGGAKSDYISESDQVFVRGFFPSAQIRLIPHAGHWVHSDSPQDFIRTLTNFYTRKVTNAA